MVNRAVLYGAGRYDSKVMSLSPLAYWPLNDLSGSVAANQANVAYNGAYTGVDLAQAQAPFVAPYFDGANDYCNVQSAALAAAIGTTGEFTVAAWVKADATILTDGAEHRIWTCLTDASRTLYLRKTTTNNQFGCRWDGGGTAKAVTATNASSAWFHIAMTVSVTGNALKMFIDGAQVGSTQTGALALDGAINTNIIGASSFTPSIPWKGYLAHTALWIRALSSTEIANLYTWGV